MHTFDRSSRFTPRYLSACAYSRYLLDGDVLPSLLATHPNRHPNDAFCALAAAEDDGWCQPDEFSNWNED